METLCRVCGSPGSYDIYGKIPRFLNTDRRDLWRQPICKMVSDVTGIPVSNPGRKYPNSAIVTLNLSFQITKNDGLPERICGLCISYMKHAVSFRNRAVQTRLSLISAAFVSSKDPFEDFGITCDNEANDGERVVSKELPQTAEIISPNRKDVPAFRCRKLERFFDYEEKSFVEDDMTKFDGMEGIEVNHPEVFRERKCGFCLKKFMLEDTYDAHLDDCLFRTLLEFIKDSNYIVRLKDEVTISNHEFIRRMVFAIQRVHKAIRGMQLPSATITDEVPTDLTIGRSETPPGKAAVQQQTMPPKVLHFFQQHTMGPPPSPPLHPLKSMSTNFIPPFNPNRPPPNMMREGKPLINNNSLAKRSPHSFFKARTVSGDSSSRGSLKTPSPTNSNGIRRVVCKFCDKTFLTISHLDGHMIKEHT